MPPFYSRVPAAGTTPVWCMHVLRALSPETVWGNVQKFGLDATDLFRFYCCVQADASTLLYKTIALQGMCRLVCSYLYYQRNSPLSVEIARMIEIGVKESQALDTEALCIIGGEKVGTPAPPFLLTLPAVQRWSGGLGRSCIGLGNNGEVRVRTTG